VISLADYTAPKVRSLFSGMEDLRVRWMDAVKRAETIRLLNDRGIDFEAVAVQVGKPDADPFDLLCHISFNAPVLTCRQRADRVKKERAAFFEAYAPEAREILENLLEKYAVDGELQFTLPDVLKVPPISEHGNVNEIIGKFGVSFLAHQEPTHRFVRHEGNREHPLAHRSRHVLLRARSRNPMNIRAGGTPCFKIFSPESNKRNVCIEIDNGILFIYRFPTERKGQKWASIQKIMQFLKGNR